MVYWGLVKNPAPKSPVLTEAGEAMSIARESPTGENGQCAISEGRVKEVQLVKKTSILG